MGEAGKAVLHEQLDNDDVFTQESAEPCTFDGSELRALRKARRLSLTELAERADLSIGYLSQIERNISTPSVKALGSVARSLDVTVAWFFGGGNQGPSNEKGLVVRKANRRRIIFREGFVDYLLSPTLEGSLELILTHFEPQASTGDKYVHRGEEGGMVMQGKIEITVGERSFILEEGDSFNFPSSEPHRYRNVSDGETIVMYAITPPSY
ncbi:MAG: transcriptional regulator with XRE-family HTH domain [Gammaproteobacteria bacterium]|jgi:transcriptional regulator with XRE-family HTH domain